jgi:peptide/nickel transport system permease protein
MQARLLSEENRQILFSLLKRNPMYVFAAIVLTLYLSYSLVFGIYPGILRYNPVTVHLETILRPPSWAFPLGTDKLGRNLLYEVLYGAPIDAAIALSVVLLSFAIGAITGSVAGYFGGVVDEVVMRVTDVFLAFPGLVLVVAVSAALGAGVVNAFVALEVVWWPIYTRLARGETLVVKEQQYVLAAKVSGLARFSIVRAHVIKNIITPMIAYATGDVGNVIIVFSVLGYLGLGAQPPLVDLGRIVYDGQNYVQFAPWYPILPGVVLFVIVISFALMGDLLRDYLDPKMRM